MVKYGCCNIAFFIAIVMTPAALFAGAGDPPHIADDYVISFGPQWSVIPGDPAFFLPINVSFSQPTVRINLFLTYDPTILTPTLLAPNIFLQGFTYDLSAPGKIKLSIITDLPPPPIIPPLEGDTTVAWISFRITSRFIGYDYLTNIDYFEDPTTPFGDNFIVLENNDRINPPALVLQRGNLLVRLPIYGDINVNTFPWEIGDAVTFLNFFMGAPFTRQQYANSDCNHDGVQASISDLVFLLRVISYDSLAAHRPDGIFAGTRTPEGTPGKAGLLMTEEGRCDIVLEPDAGVGGAAFTLKLGGNAGSVEEIFLYPEASEFDLAYTVVDRILRIAVIDWDGQASPFDGGPLLGIRYTGDVPPALESTDFSDPSGSRIEPDAYLECGVVGIEEMPSVSGLSLSGYPNPFNSAAAIRLTLPSDGRYEVEVFDVLGRKVRNLLNDFRYAGSNDIIWDGADDSGIDVSSGAYFVRLKGEPGSRTIKLHLLK